MTREEINDMMASGQGEQWRKWFAWRPVQLDTGEWVWWETIERRDFELGWGCSRHQKRRITDRPDNGANHTTAHP